MAYNCDEFRTNLAAQTPVFDEMFLAELKPMDSPVTGRHETGAWEDGTGDTHFFDRIHVGQPDLSQEWQRIDAAECENACSPPRVFVGFGTERNSYFKEQMQLQSQPFCLTQMRHQTKPAQQVAEIYRSLKKIPDVYNTDFIRVNAFKRAPEVQIAGSTFGTFVPDSTPPGNISGQLTTVNLGGAGNLPTSELTFTYLDYLTTILALEGYSTGSNLADGMYNLITDPRVWFKMTNGAQSLKDMMALTEPQQASALYKIGQGIQKPFGNIAPTLDKQQIRFQDMGGGVLNRVYPYTNVATTTGIKRQVNTAWVNARYGLSFLWHPRAIKIWTPSYKKLGVLIPSVNSSFYGRWNFVNPQGVIQIENPDGTICTHNNDDQRFFYWLVNLELGFEYKYPEILMPILHLIDGSGKDCTVDSPVCGDAPQYVAQDYSNNPDMCET